MKGLYSGDVGRWTWVPTIGSEIPNFKSTISWEKIPGLQGPIDDVYLSPFLVVLPDLMGDAAIKAEPGREAVHRWVESEAPHQIERWEGLCRGR